MSIDGKPRSFLENSALDELTEHLARLRKPTPAEPSAKAVLTVRSTRVAKVLETLKNVSATKETN